MVSDLAQFPAAVERVTCVPPWPYLLVYGAPFECLSFPCRQGNLVPPRPRDPEEAEGPNRDAQPEVFLDN